MHKTTSFPGLFIGPLPSVAPAHIGAVDICLGLALTVAAAIALFWADSALLASLPSDAAREAVRAALSCGDLAC